MPQRQSPRSRPPAPALDADFSQTSEAIALTILEANRRWCALQIEAMEAALAENTQQAKALLDTSTRSADAFAAWPRLYEEKTRRYTELTQIGLELATQTFSQLNLLMEQLLSASLAATQGAWPDASAAEQEDAFTDRRVAARIISFPDRRKASLAAAIATETAAHRAAASKRRKAA